MARRRRSEAWLGQEGERDSAPQQDGRFDRLLEHASQTQETVSLDQPTAADDPGLGESLEDAHAIAPAEVAEHVLLGEHLNALLDQLPARERRIVELRFGLLDGHARTLREVSEDIGVTRERIRQVEGMALERMRQSAGVDHLRVYLA